MGVNVNCYLSVGTRIRDVAKVAAALLGNQVTRQEDTRGGTAIFANVQGVKCTSTTVLEMADIVIDLSVDNPAAQDIRKSDGAKYGLIYHYESSKPGMPLLMPASTAAKIALCVGLAKFFGGIVDFNDCDSRNVDYRSPARDDIHAEDGEPWNSL